MIVVLHLAIETVVEVSLVIWDLRSRPEFGSLATQFCFFLTSSRDFRAFKFTDGCSRGCVEWVRLFCKLRDYPFVFCLHLCQEDIKNLLCFFLIVGISSFPLSLIWCWIWNLDNPRFSHCFNPHRAWLLNHEYEGTYEGLGFRVPSSIKKLHGGRIKL